MKTNPEKVSGKKQRVIYYTDPTKDDFAGTHINTCTVPPDFQYVRTSAGWRIVTFIVYYGIAFPLIWLMAKVYLGLKFTNRGVLKPLRKEGFFLYGNHTQVLDAYIPPLAAFPKRAYTVASPDAVSIPGIRHLVMMLGAMPLPSDIAGFRKFLKAVSARCGQSACIAVYPEGKIWPYYTGVRPFPDASFVYPVMNRAPVVAMATTYRRRSGLFALSRRPGMTVTFSEPFRPDPALSPGEAQAALRDQVFRFIDSVTRETPQVCYIRYEQRPEQAS